MADELKAQNGDKIKFHYHGKLDDGQVFDSSRGEDPLEFTLGAGDVIPGIEDAIMGMSPGQTKSVRILPDQAYGDHEEDLVAEFPLDQLPEECDPEVGQFLELYTDDDEEIPARIIELTEDSVTLDANHPLAGEALNFDLELVEIIR